MSLSLKKTSYKSRREVTTAFRGDVRIWIVKKVGLLRYSLVWFDCGGERPVEITRHQSRSKLVDLAKRLERIPGGSVWCGAFADDAFVTLESAYLWMLDMEIYADTEAN